jgi:hypothetical protein
MAHQFHPENVLGLIKTKVGFPECLSNRLLHPGNFKGYPLSLLIA